MREVIETEEETCLFFIPALVALLYRAESLKGSPLTEQEVLAIRDAASVIALPLSVAKATEEARGYADLHAEDCWNKWQNAREALFSAPEA